MKFLAFKIIQFFSGVSITRKDFALALTYGLGWIIISTFIHELAHSLVALRYGVGLADLHFGFSGINPSVKFPPTFNGVERIIAYYAGGMISALFTIPLYLIIFSRFNNTPKLFYWIIGLLLIINLAYELSIGYLEGRYHTAYIIGASSAFSVTSLFTLFVIVFAIYLHFQIFSWRKMRGRT